jgi:lysophospholipase L1-like esterase
MVDREYPRDKPPDTIRIALLGDSVAASLYLAPELKFKALWEKQLSAQLGRSVEVLNFAVDGTGTWEQLQLFHLRAREFHPDYVVLAFFWGNDVWNNDAARGKGGPDPLKDEYPPPDWKQKIRVMHRNANRWLWNHTLAYQFLRTLVERTEAIVSYKRSLERAQAQQAAASRIAADPVQDPAFAWDSEAWELTRALMLKLNAEAVGVGAKLAVTGTPSLAQIASGKPLPHQALDEFLARQGIRSLDVLPAMERMSRDKLEALYIRDRIHLNAEGHRLFAESTGPALQAWIGRGAER